MRNAMHHAIAVLIDDFSPVWICRQTPWVETETIEEEIPGQELAA
jgi:hypothetical protein